MLASFSQKEFAIWEEIEGIKNKKRQSKSNK